MWVWEKGWKGGVQCGHGNKEAGLQPGKVALLASQLRELSSRQKMMRGRGFARTWRERMRRAICLERPEQIE